MRQKPEVLAILNTKRDVLALLDMLDVQDTFQLSTLLCGPHRRDILREVCRRLTAGARAGWCRPKW